MTRPSVGRSSRERRKHHRLPLLHGLIEPISLRYKTNSPLKKTAKFPKGDPAVFKAGQPAVLTNLSGGGMSLITFIEPPHAKKLSLDLSLPGLDHVPIEAKVVRVHTKGDTFNVGLQFTRIPKMFREKISTMAADHRDCETRLSLRLPEACAPKCRYNRLCRKPQKAPHWPPKV